MEYNLISIIPKALEYYDKNDNINDFLRNKIKYTTEYRMETSISSNDITESTFTIKNKINGKNILLANFEFIGFYDNINHIWIWAWSLDYPKNVTKTSRKVLMYGLELESDNFTGLKQQLITSRFKITDTIQLDIFIGLFAYLVKNNHIIYTDKLSKDKSYYIRTYYLLKNVKIYEENI